MKKYTVREVVEEMKNILELCKQNSNDIEVIDEELHSQVPTRKGLCYQVNELQQAVQSIKRVIYISTGVMFAIQGLPVIRQILIILTK